MPKIAMPLRDRHLIIRYLGGAPDVALPGSNLAVSAPRASTPGASGASLYATWCAGCHGAAGNGDGPNARFLPVAPARHADSRVTAKRSDDFLYDMIAAGGAPMGRSARMPAFGATLSSDDLRRLVKHIRALCRCTAPAWTTDGDGR